MNEIAVDVKLQKTDDAYSLANAHIWDTDQFFTYLTKDLCKSVSASFTEEQRMILVSIVKRMLFVLEYHTVELERMGLSPHKGVRDQIEKLEAKLRNHRHEMNQLYSSKPEF